MDEKLEKLRGAIADAVAGMSEEEWNRHPEGKWCAAEVLEHLYLTYTGTVKGFDRVLETGKPMVSPASMRHGWRTLMVLGFSHIPSGRKAPKNTEPRGLPPEKVRAEFGPKLAAMDEIIARCEARFGSDKLLDHTILGPLTAAQWRKFHLVHGRHHVKQILRLRERIRRGL